MLPALVLAPHGPVAGVPYERMSTHTRIYSASVMYGHGHLLWLFVCIGILRYTQHSPGAVVLLLVCGVCLLW
jgi:hypothetical protein